MPDFRYRINNGAWTVIEGATLPYNIAAVLATDEVDVQAIGLNVQIDPAPVTLNTLVSNRAQPGTTEVAITAPLTTRRVHYADARGDITNIKTIDLGWYYTAGTVGEINLGNAYTIKRSIEYPAGVFHPVKWSTVAQVTVPNGGQSVSDVVISSVTGLPLVVPAGVQYFERTGAVSSANMPCIEQPAGSVALGIPDGSVATDSVNSGTIAASTSINRLGCAAIIGDIASANARTFVMFGDSIAAQGVGDITSQGVRMNWGYFGRWMDLMGYSCLKLGRGGIYASALATNNTKTTALLGQFNATDFVLQAGVNDLANGRTQAELEADYLSIFNKAGIVGKTRHQCTLTPRSSSTDAYATTVNQTPKTDGTWTSLTAVNDAIRAMPAHITGQVFDVADIAMTARNSGIWKAPPQPVTDGAHPTSSMAAYIAAGLPAI